MKHCVILLLSLLPLAANALCQSSTLMATYEIERQHGTQPPTLDTLVLVRHGDNVLHIHPNAGLSEGFHRTATGAIQVIRHFDQHQRSIEYAPNEKVHGRQEADWSLRYQLISNDLLNHLPVNETQGQGCERQQIRQRVTDSERTTLHWQPEQQRMSALSVVRENYRERWTLKAVSTDAQAIQQAFEQRLGYQTTDYADIGDDHTDPFLLRMVNLGFIEAGASGFYNADGKALEGHHQH
ncbi:hypothetical protein LJ739_08105 [Aestuariibacter halophilus]|uniref:Uncharacterized protein n=1 Tax=Fluctibacter halophilus TaxID=226011 RepID=A0ABS8G6I0_9ALTE|nr:hypothetical protein [Aestuariibacter halophilus]MCC2616199.1 hypothetical protein [Aestuariibacter halophilus]